MKKQFVEKKKETINWNITVRNNKDVKPKIFVEDQFPIFENKLIEIEQIESSNGKVNQKTGLIIWEL